AEVEQRGNGTRFRLADIAEAVARETRDRTIAAAEQRWTGPPVGDQPPVQPEHRVGIAPLSFDVDGPGLPRDRQPRVAGRKSRTARSIPLHGRPLRVAARHVDDARRNAKLNARWSSSSPAP